MARSVVSGVGWAPQATEAHPRMIASAFVVSFIGTVSLNLGRPGSLAQLQLGDAACGQGANIQLSSPHESGNTAKGCAFILLLAEFCCQGCLFSGRSQPNRKPQQANRSFVTLAALAGVALSGRLHGLAASVFAHIHGRVGGA